MKIAIASLAQETNTFSPLLTTLDNFQVLRGEDVLKKHFTAAEILNAEGFDLIPILAAYALPGGTVKKAAFLKLCTELVDGISPDVSGVWLMLHGGMFVQEIGSGEEYLLRRLREKIGWEVPIAVCMDMHANLTDEYVRRVNIIRGYHTAPHEDWDYQNCCRITAQALAEAVKGRKMVTWISRVPIMLPGEAFMTDYSPARESVALSLEAEKEPGVVAATVFVGMAWCDCPCNTLSIVLTLKGGAAPPEKLADPIRSFLLSHRLDFKIPSRSLPLDKAVAYCEESVKRPFFISDSGDNVTAGGAGENALCLDYLLKSHRSGYLIAGLLDPEFVCIYWEKEENDLFTASLGGKTDPMAVSILSDGKIIGRMVRTIGSVSDIRILIVDFSGNTAIVTDKRCSFTETESIRMVAGDVSSYQGVFIKLGYLFPDLRQVAADSCIALTPGSCCLDLAQLPYKNKG